jgi:hypothetical protein
MFYIIETAEQLQQLHYEDNAYIEVIVGNNNYHPKLTQSVAIYYRSTEKGYIFPINHTEAFKIDLELVKSFLSKHAKLYCFDKKFSSYFIDLDNLVDLGFIILDKENKLPELEETTQIQRELYRDYYYKEDINRIIPISKLYETAERKYQKVSQYIGGNYDDFYDRMIKVYKKIEEAGIQTEEKILNKHFELNYSAYTIKDNTLYTTYNLHNLTSRPTNSGNGINLLALNKETGGRAAFVPKKSMFLELDFVAYHPSLLGIMTGFYDRSEDIYTAIGEERRGRAITPEEREEEKQRTFQAIYGGFSEEDMSITFFSQVAKLQAKLAKEMNTNGYVKLPTGRILHKSENLYPQKIFNYYIQNLETYTNVEILEEVLELLDNHRSKVNLVVYDSFLIDFDVLDGKAPILKIQEITKKHGLNTKLKYGNNYNNLQKS